MSQEKSRGPLFARRVRQTNVICATIPVLSPELGFVSIFPMVDFNGFAFVKSDFLKVLAPFPDQG
jgi:hypothetical protein